jgi:iron complex transport system ATP-binding protein
MGELIFETRAASYRYPAAHEDAVRAVTLAVPRGELVAIVGPNGSGKTTLLRLLLGVLRPSDGAVLAGGRAAHGWRRRELARLVGVVAQREEPVFPLRVHQAVLLGRYAHLGPFRAARGVDLEAVERALERCDVSCATRWKSSS